MVSFSSLRPFGPNRDAPRRSEHLGFSQKLEKGVPSNDASLSMRRTLREAGVKVPGVAKKKTDPYGIDRPEHLDAHLRAVRDRARGPDVDALGADWWWF